jgi:hypothetical protein
MREFLAGIRGGRHVPGVLERAWDNYNATKIVPPKVQPPRAVEPIR